MENTVKEISTKNYYSTRTGLNVELPDGMNKIDREIRYNDLNKAISDEDRASYFGKVIPLAEQDRILKSYKPKKEGAVSSFFSNLAKSSYNTTQDIATAPYEWLIQKGSVIGVASAGVVGKAKGLPVTDEDKAQAVLETMEEYNPDYESTKFDLDEQDRWSAGWWGQGTGSISSAITAAIITGNVAPLSVNFGAMTDKEVTKARLEKGDSLLVANARGGVGGTAVALLEKLHLNKVVSKVALPRVQRYVARFGTGSTVETLQEVVETTAKGDADTRTKEQKMEALLQNAIFGGLGDVVGHMSRDVATRKQQKAIKEKAKKSGVDDTTATEIAQTAMVDEKPNFDKLRSEVNKRQNKRRSDLYDAFIEQGDSPERASAKANELVPTYEEVEKEIWADLESDKMLTEEEISELGVYYDEAVSVGGDEAESYIKAKDELKQKLVNAGVEDEKADKEARMFTGIVVNGYQAYKDTERALGREPTKGFDEVKEEFYKLNSVINHSIDDTNEMWADYDARNQTEFNEEQDMVEGKPSRKLYSFAGERAANLTKEQKTSLDEAKSLEGGLLSAEEIRQTTGWFKGTDNKWRLEISDRDASIKTENLKEGKLKLKDILEHNKLFKAYPQLKEANVVYSNKVKDVAEVEKSPVGVRIILGNGFTKESESEKRKTLMHEVQHLIQGMEKFARGGSSREFRSPKQDLVQKIRNNNRVKIGLELLGLRGNSVNLDNVRTVANMLIAKGDPESEMVKKALEFQRLDKALAEYDKNTAYGKYLRLEGETESRNVATRIDLTEEERRAISPEMTRDVPREEAIIRFDDGTEINYTNQENGKLYQKAWHGGQNLEGGKFSLKYAGKVTGQTHGYGVYASAQRDTGEYYRSRIDNSFTVKGEDITDLYSRLERKKEYDKLAIIEDLMLGKDVDALYEGTQEKAWFDKEIKPYLKSEGKLYELEVPEDYELIDEQKRFSEQPEAVQEILLKTSKENKGFGLLEKAIKDDEYGGVLYNALGVDVFYETKGYEGGSTETRVAGSEFLDKEGIKGITYDGGTEGKNFVIFNPDNVQVLEKFYSKNDGDILGSYDPYTREVELFKGQNPSTLTHELGHHFLLSHLRLMESMGLKDRNAPVFEWLSKVVGRDINSVADMEEIEGDVINPHEALVEAFISYMNNGEAPNLVTENIFKRAKDWLLDRFRVHKTEASTEIRDYFDSIIARDETIPDMSGLTTRTREIAEILKQAKNGEQVSFKGLGKKELKELQKAFHSRVRRKGRSLRDMIIERGGIKEGTELAKSLGFDVLKKDKMYTTKDTAFDNEAELIDWLAEEGLIVGVQEGEDYSATERRWEDVQRLIDNAENTYTVRESLINQERETALANQAHVQEIVDELLKDNDLGLKDINDLDDLLSKIVSRKDDVDITKVNSNAIKYLNERVKGLNKEIKALERNKNKEFKNKREEQYLAQNDLKDFIRGLPINNQHKVALMGNIQRVKDYDSLAQIVNDLKPRIKGYIEQEAKFLLSKNIDTIVKKTKPKERKKQNFNYDYNKLFEELREYNKLNKEQALEKRNEILETFGEGIEFDEFEKLKNMFLSYKANGLDSSVALMKQLNDELNAIYQEAVNDRMETLEQLGQERNRKITEVVGYIEKTKPVNKLNQLYLKMTNINSNLSELFGKKWADEHKMDSYLVERDIEVNRIVSEVFREGKDIYGLKNRNEFAKLYTSMKEKKYLLVDYIRGKSKKISKSEVMDIYLTIKNKNSAEAYRKRYEITDKLGNQTTSQINDLVKLLTPEDRHFADMLQKRINDLYDAENKVYIKLYGIDMPKIDNYWMRTSDPNERPLMDVKRFMNLDMLPSYMKNRSNTPNVHPDDVLKKFSRRISDSKYMTVVFEKYKDLYDIIHNTDVRDAIIDKYDESRYSTLTTSLERLSLGDVHDKQNVFADFFDKAFSNWVVSSISISESVFVNQLHSLANYAEKMPVMDFLKYQAEFWANPKKAWEFMNDFAGEYLNNRYKSGLQDELLHRILNADSAKNQKLTMAYQKWLEGMTSWVRYGDILAIRIGGYSRARYLIEQGVPLEKARKMFIDETESSQQSGNKAELAEFQNTRGLRPYTSFKNTNIQYTRKAMDALIQWGRGEISAQQAGKTWGLYMLHASIMYQATINFFSWLNDDDEDIKWFKDMGMRISTAILAGIPVISDAVEGVFAENYWGLNVAGKQDMERFISAARDVIDLEFDARKISKGLAGFISFFTVIPRKQINRVVDFITD